jgi:hypothetical protein
MTTALQLELRPFTPDEATPSQLSLVYSTLLNERERAFGSIKDALTCAAMFGGLADAAASRFDSDADFRAWWRSHVPDVPEGDVDPARKVWRTYGKAKLAGTPLDFAGAKASYLSLGFLPEPSAPKQRTQAGNAHNAYDTFLAWLARHPVEGADDQEAWLCRRVVEELTTRLATLEEGA